MSDLSSALVAATPREVSGARTMAKYGYQAHIGLLKILELHQAGSDYRMIFDYIDDLALLDSSTAPTAIQTFQVKAKSAGSWSIANIAYRGATGSLPRSIIGKMYFNIADMKDYVAGVSFVSNAPFAVTLSTGKKSGETDTLIQGKNLDPTEIAKLDKAISNDFIPHPGHPYIERLSMQQSSLGIMEQDVFLKGKLADFLENVAGLKEAPVNAVYDTLIASAIARTGTARTYADVQDFYQQKSLSKSDMDRLVAGLKSKKGFLENWSTIELDLIANGLGTVEIIRIKTAAVKHMNSRTSGDRVALSFSDSVRTLLAAKPVLLSDATSLHALASLMKTELAPILATASWTMAESTGACLVEAYEALDG